eukprot:gene21254-28171_t
MNPASCRILPRGRQPDPISARPSDRALTHLHPSSLIPPILRSRRVRAAAITPDVDDKQLGETEVARLKLQKMLYKGSSSPDRNQHAADDAEQASTSGLSRSPERELRLLRIERELKRVDSLHSGPTDPDTKPPPSTVPIPSDAESETASTSSRTGSQVSSSDDTAAVPATDSDLRQASVASTSGTSPTEPSNETNALGVPKSVLVISLVSAALTLSSCVFNTLLPIYMVSELKMSMQSMGMFEGLMEAFSYIVRMFSGVMSDMMSSRKSAITLGFAMGASAKFGMSGAVTVTQLFTAKAIDRLANGVQAAPRDALISDLAPAKSRSACFGFAQSMRKWGSAVGASMVFFLMKASGNNYQMIFMLAAGISALSCVAFVVLVPNHVRPQSDEEKARKAESKKGGFEFSQLMKDVVSMGSDFYRMLAVIACYTMCHINESMLEARAMEVGFGKAESSLVVAILALAIFLMAYPLGRLDDKFGPRTTFAVGVGALVMGNLTLLASATYPYAVFVSLFFLGAHWAIVQGPMLAIVAGFAPAHMRGTAFGIFYSMMAVTAIGSNSMFGAVWTAYSAQHAFMLSGVMALALFIGLPHMLPKNTRTECDPVLA